MHVSLPQLAESLESLSYVRIRVPASGASCSLDPAVDETWDFKLEKVWGLPLLR